MFSPLKLVKRHNAEKVYSNQSVVEYYSKLQDLQPCEELLFSKHLKDSVSVLDIGVGGGRTTPYLSEYVNRYVGIDFSDGMIKAAKIRFPLHDLRVCKAENLSCFADCEFDSVVFSFNGIDYITTDSDRTKCLSEIYRVLKKGGVFIFSSHNARYSIFLPCLSGVALHKSIWRIVLSAYKSFRISLRLATSGAWASQAGYYLDPVHGGLLTYSSTPLLMRQQLDRAGFTLVEYVSGCYPRTDKVCFTPWWYYACKKQ